MKVRTFKEKNKLLATGTLLVGLISYWFAFSQTVELYQQNNSLSARLDSAQAAPEQIAKLKTQLAGYEQSVNRFSLTKSDWEQRLLQEITRVCQQQQVKLIQLPPSAIEESNGYSLETRVVKLQGRYKNLVQALHHLETKHTIGRISSVQFSLEEERKTRKTFLFAYVYLQNIEKQ